MVLLFPPARQDSRFLILEPKVQVSYFWRSWRAVGQLQPGSLRNEARPSICAVSVKFYVTHSRFYTTRVPLNSNACGLHPKTLFGHRAWCAPARRAGTRILQSICARSAWFVPYILQCCSPQAFYHAKRPEIRPFRSAFGAAARLIHAFNNHPHKSKLRFETAARL